jgi:hypothetical protein
MPLVVICVVISCGGVVTSCAGVVTSCFLWPENPYPPPPPLPPETVSCKLYLLYVSVHRHIVQLAAGSGEASLTEPRDQEHLLRLSCRSPFPAHDHTTQTAVQAKPGHAHQDLLSCRTHLRMHVNKDLVAHREVAYRGGGCVTDGCFQR